jgi:iron complex transport system ATP-binding protein
MNIQIQQLTIPYSKYGALNTINFSCDKPELIFIVGENGIGKSTFLKLLSKELPSQNTIFFQQKPLETFSNKALSKHLGYLKQKHDIEFPLKAQDVILLGLYPHQATWSAFTKEDYTLVKTKLEELQIAYVWDQNFLSLSGGEQQLCLLAQLSLQNPEVVLLDEPTQQLDLYHKKRIFNWMQEQVLQYHKTVFCVTHDIHLCHDYKGTILFFQKNKISVLPNQPEQIQYITEQLLNHYAS